MNFDFSFMAFQCRYLFILCISVLQITYVNPKTLLIKKKTLIFLKQLLVCLLISVYSLKRTQDKRSFVTKHFKPHLSAFEK